MITTLQVTGWQRGDVRSLEMHLGSQTHGMGMMGMEDMPGTDMSSVLGDPYSYFTATSSEKSPVPRAANQRSQESRKMEDLVLRILQSSRHPIGGAISTPHPITGQTLLHFASALGLSKLVSALIAWKANVLIPDKNGFSPVHFACFYGRIECVEILVRAGRAHLEGRNARGRTPLDVCGTEEVRELVLELEEEVETRKRKSRIGSEVESGGEGDDEGLSWSEGDDEEDDSWPTAIPGAEAPQPVSRLVSRVNSVASIASHKAVSRAATPYLVDDVLTPTTPKHSIPAQPLSPPSPSSYWGLGRNISWPSGGWPFPNVPAMPQFGQRRGDGPKEKHGNDDLQEEKEQMFKWMVWMDTARKMWQQQQQQQITEVDNDPPPMYSPTGAASASDPSHGKGTSNAVGAPAAPVALDEPPSPLTLDLPCGASTAPAGPSVPHAHRRGRQRRSSYSRPTDDDSNETSSLAVAVGRRKTKTIDTMLILFWIPVLLCMFLSFFSHH